MGLGDGDGLGRQGVHRGRLGGGGGTTFSKFRLTKLDVNLPCPPSEGSPGIGVTVEGPGDSEATLTRLQNSGPGECKPIPAALEFTEDENHHPVVRLFKVDLGQSVVSTFTITWPPEPAPEPGENGVLGAIPLSQQVFGTDDPIPLDLCVGTPTGYVEDPPAHPGEFLILGTGWDDRGTRSVEPGRRVIQYGCVYERRITIPADNTIALKQWIYLRGDWGASRN